MSWNLLKICIQPVPTGDSELACSTSDKIDHPRRMVVSVDLPVPWPGLHEIDELLAVLFQDVLPAIRFWPPCCRTALVHLLHLNSTMVVTWRVLLPV